MSPRNRPRLVLSAPDVAKIERLWNEHATSILGMLKAFCACPEDAQDALQELFLRVGKNIAVVESAKSPRAFLIVSARRIAIDAARKRAADLRREESPEAAEAVHPEPVSFINDADLSNAISRAIADLPSEQRIVFQEKVLHGKTLAVIAAEQSITLNTAASRLRYSLDKIRTRLRPHYKAMKNQPAISHSLSDFSGRLIKPLEPKRVPSVVPGLEGVAALAVADGHIETLDVHEPVLCVCPAPVDIPAPQPVEHMPYSDPVPQPVEDVPHIKFNLAPQPVEHMPYFNTAPQPVDHSALENIDSGVSHGSEPVNVEFHDNQTDDASHGSQELLSVIFESNFTNQDGSVDHADSHNEGLQVEHPVLGEFFNFEVQPGHTNVDAEQSSDASGISEFNEHDFNESLLTEYKSFLSDHPDWVEAHSGGEIQPQVITSSEYTGIDWENPGAAHSFDQWFHETYIAPYEGSSPAEGGTLVLAPDMHDHGTVVLNGDISSSAWMGAGTLQLSGSGLINGGLVHGDGTLQFNPNHSPGDGHQLVLDRSTTIPESWMRGGILELSGGQLIVNNNIAMHDQVGGGTPTLILSGGSPFVVNGAGVAQTQNLVTEHDISVPALGDASHTIVTGGRVVAADPIAGSFTVENGGSLSIGDRVFGEGTYNFHSQTGMDSQSHGVADVVASAETHTVAAKPEAHSVEAHGTSSMEFSVTPIVSGSDSPITHSEVPSIHDGHSVTPMAALHVPSLVSVELPVLIHSQEIQHLDTEFDHETGITFVDDDSHVAPVPPHSDGGPVGVTVAATHDVAAAVGGAFVAGSATQVTPVAKGLSLRKRLIG